VNGSIAFGNGTFTRRGPGGNIVEMGNFRVSGNTVIFANSEGEYGEGAIRGFSLRVSGASYSIGTFNRTF